MTNGIVKYDGNGAALDVMGLGKVLASSGYFQDTRDAAQAVVKVLAGQEMGIGPIAAMTGINIIKGRVSISANLMAGQVKRSGRYNYQVVELTDKICRLVFTESGKEIGRSDFSIEDAKRAGTQNIDKFPRNMLFARAMSNGVKWFCPEIFSGPVYTPDELSSITTDAAPTQYAPPAPVDDDTGEIIEDGTQFAESEPVKLREAATYASLGKKLTTKYGYTRDGLREVEYTYNGHPRMGLIYSAAQVEVMEQGEYDRVISEMQRLERDALKAGKGDQVEAPPM